MVLMIRALVRSVRWQMAYDLVRVIQMTPDTFLVVLLQLVLVFLELALVLFVNYLLDVFVGLDSIEFPE